VVSPTLHGSPASADRPATDEHERVVSEALARGDWRAVLTQLMRSHGREVLRFCQSMLEDPAAAEDARQAVFVDVYESLPSYRERGNLRGWIFTIARHRCLDVAKAERRHRSRYPLDAKAGQQLADDRPGADGQLDQPRRSALLRQCLRALDSAVRVAVLLRYEEGLALEEIARMSRELPGTVQARVARALPRLRDCLRSKGVAL
jgi:RNA polymerase sigma-70 factor (ECF subfamily)